jgi:hypothetical protein
MEAKEVLVSKRKCYAKFEWSHWSLKARMVMCSSV